MQVMFQAQIQAESFSTESATQGWDWERRSDQRDDALQVQRQGLPDRLYGAGQSVHPGG